MIQNRFLVMTYLKGFRVSKITNNCLKKKKNILFKQQQKNLLKDFLKILETIITIKGTNNTKTANTIAVALTVAPEKRQNFQRSATPGRYHKYLRKIKPKSTLPMLYSVN